MNFAKLISPIRNASHAQRVVAAVAIALSAAMLLQFVQLCRGPRGDFANHWEFGRRMAAGEAIYADGLNVVYPPLWSFVHAPLTVLPPHAAQILLFPLFALALALLGWILLRLTRNHFPATREARWCALALAVLLTGRFLFRDMVECGANLALVAVVWLAIYLWSQRRDAWAGVCLGLAVSLKCTPLAFVAYFVWKRQWRVVAASLIAALAFSLAPALWMGKSRYVAALATWSSYVKRGLTEQNPQLGVLGTDTVQNLSLRPALADWLQAMAPENSVAVGWAIKLILASLALAVAWQFRRRVDDRTSRTVLWECAIISLAMLLYSPITWTQHCVGILPAMFLLMLSARSPSSVPRWGWLVLAGYVLLVLVLNRAVLGREISLLLLSYHVHALGLVGLFAVALACHQRAVASTHEDALAKIAEPCTLRRQKPATT